jgi:hypothetical protein
MIDHVLISPRRVRIRVLVVGIVALLMASLLPGPAAEAQVGRQSVSNATTTPTRSCSNA